MKLAEALTIPVPSPTGTTLAEEDTMLREDSVREVLARLNRGEQVALYSEMAITAAKSNREKLAKLIDHMENLPPPAHEQLLAHLGSDAVITMPEADRLVLWTELVDMVTKHNRKFSDAGRAMKPEQVDKIAAFAERLAPDAPAFRHQRLFSERDFGLYEEKGNYEDQP